MYAYMYAFYCVLKVHTGKSKKCVGIVGDAVDPLVSSKAKNSYIQTSYAGRGEMSG